MKTGLTSSRIPYIHAVNGKRWNPIEGCSNTGGICAVRGLGLCWAENLSDADQRKQCSGSQSYCSIREEDGCFNCDEVITSFKPTFHPEVLTAPLRTRKPYTIFTGFGGDLWSEGVDPKWRDDIFGIETLARHHTFVHLTKCPENIQDDEDGWGNVWHGASICNKSDISRLEILMRLARRTTAQIWASFEPVLESVGDPFLAGLHFVVIGGLSDGNGRIVPPDEGGTRPEWIQPILDAAGKTGCKIFCKNIDGIWRKLANPRTGKVMESPYELRETPDAWRKS